MKHAMLMQVGVMIYMMKCSNKAIWLKLCETGTQKAVDGP